MTEPNNSNNLTPPPELVQKWIQKATGPDYEQRIAAQAARWGADKELEACCAEVSWFEAPAVAYKLRERRRPQPPSLKEQALRHVDIIQDNWAFLGDGEHASPSLTGQITYKQLQDIRSALEQLPEGPAVTPPAAAPDRPLWKAMHAAFERVLQEDAPESGHFYAAELTIVADWLERKWPQGPDMHPCVCAAWLRTEAERAEEAQ